MNLTINEPIQLNKVFVLVEASKLKKEDDFLNYQPKSKKEQTLKELIIQAISSGVKDFYKPIYDPAFFKGNSKICYFPGRKVAIGRSYSWWEKCAKEFLPSRNSRLGTKNEYIAFLGVLIKKMVESGWKLEEAWDAVCNDSGKLGHYISYKDEKVSLEVNGSREVCGFFDLANVFKILAKEEDNTGFWVASGAFNFYGSTLPLADLFFDNNFYGACKDGVGWIILEK